MRFTPNSSKPQGRVANTLDDKEVLYSKIVTVSEDRIKLTKIWLMDSGATRNMTPC
jgi:hypothetical protein